MVIDGAPVHQWMMSFPDSSLMLGKIHIFNTRWYPSSLANLVNITPTSLWFMMVYGRYICTPTMVYKPTNITGGHHHVVRKPPFTIHRTRLKQIVGIQDAKKLG
jgi:hypothetical protein